MMNEKLDKIISSIFLLGSFGLIVWWLNDGMMNGLFSYFSNNKDQSWMDVIQSNWQMILPIYFFICFQAAGISEIRKGQDYLHAVVISIFFTPISLIFMNGENDE